MLIAIDDDRVWIYAAMIVIYFIAWVLKRIKGVAGANKEERPAPPKRTLADVQENRKRHLERQAKRESGSDDASEVLRRLFESIADETEEQKPSESFLPEPEPASSQPPPLKKAPATPPLAPPPLSPSDAKPSSVSKRLSPAEQKALAKLKSKKQQHARAKRKLRPHSLRSMTRGRGLQQAVVLKEILDQPRALRPY